MKRSELEKYLDKKVRIILFDKTEILEELTNGKGDDNE